MTTNNLIIIGTGLAGYMLAKEWRKLDQETPLTMVTMDDGSFYSKPLLSTALAQQKAADQLVISNVKSMAEELNANIITLSTVTDIDIKQKTITIDDKQSLPFSQLVLACGAHPISPLINGDAAGEIKQVNHLQDYRRFREWLKDKKELLILGAGLVGCEFANDLSKAGYNVKVIMPEHAPLATFLPEKIGHLLQDALRQQGVEWSPGELAVSMHRKGQKIAVSLSSEKTLLVDGVLSAVGLRSAVQLAQKSGIQVNRGIVVNRWLQTNIPNIFALGDCAEVKGMVSLYIAPLLQSARALAQILAGGKEPVHYPAMPVVVKTSCLPLVFLAPPSGLVGEWRFEGEGSDLRALFYDDQGQLRGFALAGNTIRDKMSLAKQLPLVFNE